MFWPLRKGYYTHITFNDNAIINILNLLEEIKDGNPLYTGISDSAYMKGIKKEYKKEGGGGVLHQWSHRQKQPDSQCFKLCPVGCHKLKAEYL